MKVILVPSCCGGDASNQYLTSFVVNGRVAVDAGSLGFYRSPRDQAPITHLFVSHTHIDHLASLPIFLENIIGLNSVPVTVHCSAIVQDCLREDLFNDRIWPNFLKLTMNGNPFLHLSTLEPHKPVEVERLRITPVPVNHLVPTLGFVIEEPGAAVIIVSDTGPTQQIWDYANRTPNLKAVYLEAAFPNEMATLAEFTKHLTPEAFGVEVQKLHVPATVFAVHAKARFRDKISEELTALKLPRLQISKFDVPYEF